MVERFRAEKLEEFGRLALDVQFQALLPEYAFTEKYWYAPVGRIYGDGLIVLSPENDVLPNDDAYGWRPYVIRGRSVLYIESVTTEMPVLEFQGTSPWSADLPPGRYRVVAKTEPGYGYDELGNRHGNAEAEFEILSGETAHVCLNVGRGSALRISVDQDHPAVCLALRDESSREISIEYARWWPDRLRSSSFHPTRYSVWGPGKSFLSCALPSGAFELTVREMDGTLVKTMPVVLEEGRTLDIHLR